MTQYALPKQKQHLRRSSRRRKERKMEIELQAYIRSDDGVRMIQIKPGWFVNEQVWRRFGGGSLSHSVTPPVPHPRNEGPPIGYAPHVASAASVAAGSSLMR
jgi:hypothetical protein